MSAVSLRGIRHAFAGALALDEVNLDVGRAELFVLLGPSGSGKTTLLRLLAGLEAPEAGTIDLFGERASETGRVLRPPERRGIGFVFQDLALWPHRTALQHVLFALGGGRARRSPPEEAKRARETLRLLGLGGKERALPHELSGGEAQRLALARAIAPAPRLLLLDEPLANLDAPLRQTLAGEILRLRGETGVTILHVTHDRSEALLLADRIAILDRGRIHQVGMPDEVSRRPASAFVAEFLGEVSWIAGVAAAGGRLARTDLGEIRIEPPLAGLPDGAWVRIAARPENLALGEGGAPATVFRRHFDGREWRHELRWGGESDGGNGTILRAQDARPHAAGSRVKVRLSGAAAAFPIPEGEGAVPPRGQVASR